MSNKNRRGNTMSPLHHQQPDISDEDGPTGPGPGPGLERRHYGPVRISDGLTIVIPGLQAGNVDVTVTLYETEPSPDNGNWQLIAEVPAHSASGDLTVRGMTDDPDMKLPVLSFHRPGHYRLRLHTRARNTVIGLAPYQITKWYLIQAWPNPSRKARVLRQTDGYGASAHAR